MLWANDYNDKRVHIRDTHSNQEYYCPTCGAVLITRKGDIRQYHFAHKPGRLCSDSWERSQSHNYDTSHWHNEWQSKFPAVNQEVILALGDTKHRADVMIDRTIVEFQHSIISPLAFDDRNNFYLNLGDKVVWLFDVSELVKTGKMIFEAYNNRLHFCWKNPKRTFNKYDLNSGCIDLFFQISDGEENSIVKVVEVSINGFESFYSTTAMSKSTFLNYVGLKNGSCLPPSNDDVEKNEQYKAFKEKYNIVLNKQQERAMLAVEGANLLLAVPGSGKTTVLINRLGHMVLNKNIPPENILAITFTNVAVKEMEERFSSVFGEELAKKITFRTIHSLANDIYAKTCDIYAKSCNCDSTKVRKRNIDSTEQKSVIKNLYMEITNEDVHETDILDLLAAISYSINMCYKKEDRLNLDETFPFFSKVYSSYVDYKKKNYVMDFDDQLFFALYILTKEKKIADEYRAKYKYICVDEAQDTSKIQHEIIKILADGNNLFMVGDEDQSIYGFRAAYPKALLNFRYDYLNPYILRMDKNYRSVSEIVEKAQNFISTNKGRYNKNMIAEREEHGSVEFEDVANREEQFYRVLEIAKNAQSEVAFLYRDNQTAVILVDLFLRNNIPFRFRKPEMNFLKSRLVSNLKKYFSTAFTVDSGKELGELFDEFENLNHHIDGDSFEILRILSHQEKDIKKFLLRLDELGEFLSKPSSQNSDIILSTIHSSKGLEYDSVYMVDVYDGRFPSSKPNVFSRSKDNANGEQEERRLFYVGITRAKNKLTFFNIKDRYSQYIEEIFPEVKVNRIKEEEARKQREYKEFLERKRKKQEEEALLRAEEIQEKAVIVARVDDDNYKKRYNEVKDKFIQTSKRIYDSLGCQWLKCKCCGEIKLIEEFFTCDAPKNPNSGKCKLCKDKK